MLVKITNYCSMGCSHCMEDSTIAGTHMTMDTFAEALVFTRKFESVAWTLGCPPFLLLSGGECSEHPDFLKMISLVEDAEMIPLLITNGMWLNNQEITDEVLRPNRLIFVQVTNDSRFYPTAPPHIEDPRVTYIESIPALIPLGRAGRKKKDAPHKNAPSSFNLRSLTRTLNSFTAAVAHMRARANSGLSGHCSPSISDTGDVMAGETRNCFKIGTVRSTEEELTRALTEMTCNKCGLVGNLTMRQRRAIGETGLFGPDE